MWKLAGTGIAALVIAIVALMGFNTVRFRAATDQGETAALASTPDFNAQALATHLATALRFRTISFDPASAEPGDLAASAAAFDGLELFLRTTFLSAFKVMEVEKIGGHSLLFYWPGRDEAAPRALFMAHQDVVPVTPETLKDWTHPPFEGAIADGFVWGRGALDDKSSVIALLAAADVLATNGWRPQRGLYFLFGHDEEIGGENGAKAAIALLKARGVKIAFALDEGMAILDPFPITGKRAALIGIAEKGSVTIEVVASAEGGHSSMPPRDSAAVRLARGLIALDTHQMKGGAMEAPVGLMMRALADDLPLVTRLALANPWVFGGLIDAQFAKIPAANASVRTTTAPTMLSGAPKANVLPQKARALVNFRIHPRDTPDSVLAHVRAVTGGIPGISAEFADERRQGASPLSPTDSESYRLLAAVARAASDGAPVAPGLVVAGTDSRHASLLTREVYRFTPYILDAADLTRLHGINERISIENLHRMARSFALLLRSFGGDADPAPAGTSGAPLAGSPAGL